MPANLRESEPADTRVMEHDLEDLGVIDESKEGLASLPCAHPLGVEDVLGGVLRPVRRFVALAADQDLVGLGLENDGPPRVAPENLVAVVDVDVRVATLQAAACSPADGSPVPVDETIPPAGCPAEGCLEAQVVYLNAHVLSLLRHNHNTQLVLRK